MIGPWPNKIHVFKKDVTCIGNDGKGAFLASEGTQFLPIAHDHVGGHNNRTIFSILNGEHRGKKFSAPGKWGFIVHPNTYHKLLGEPNKSEPRAARFRAKETWLGIANSKIREGEIYEAVGDVLSWGDVELRNIRFPYERIYTRRIHQTEWFEPTQAL